MASCWFRQRVWDLIRLLVLQCLLASVGCDGGTASSNRNSGPADGVLQGDHTPPLLDGDSIRSNSEKEVADDVASVASPMASIPERVYRLRPSHTSKCIGAGDAAGEGAQVVQWDCIPQSSQFWQAELVEGGFYRFANMRSRLFLAIESPNHGNGAKVRLQSKERKGGQLFALQEVGSGLYRMTPKSNTGVLATSGGSHENGAHIIQWGWNGNPPQRWQLDPVPIDSQTPVDARPAIQIGGDYSLVFSDEFADDTLDLSKWSINVSRKSRAPRPKIGIKDWWWKAENVWEADDNLVLKVSKADHDTMHCGSINSNNKFEPMYGYFEVRMRIADASKGTHTAFWFQGDGMSNVDGTANDGAEIDVFESAWLADFTKSVVHIDGYGRNHQANTKRYNTPGIHNGEYHVWSMLWTSGGMYLYYDGGKKTEYVSPKWQVHAPEYLWLSDGASFGLKGDYFTKQPNGTLTHAYVDYVRVWRRP